MPAIAVKTYVIQDDATPALKELREKIADRTELHTALGQRGEIELRAHFETRPANKKGWPRQQFWNRIRRVTVAELGTKQGVNIVIADPAIAQKIHGGTIRPVEGKALAIPAIAEAYGRSPRSNLGLHLVLFNRGRTVASSLIPDEPAIVLANDPKFLAYDVVFSTEGGTKISIPRLPLPTLDAADLGAITLTQPTPGAALFYTLDDTQPSPRNPAATLFLAPFLANAGDRLRARAWLPG